IVTASRRLHDDFDAFLQTFEHYVTVRVTMQEIETIWRQEQQSQGFAVDGEMSKAHWDAQLKAFAALNPDLPHVAPDAVLAKQFVSAFE
ncbi:hypothetical protein N9H93_06430, partial [Rhizobiaceae bacterium]|nr:hypothetical protein [Rhizobiaceae bacterium]